MSFKFLTYEAYPYPPIFIGLVVFRLHILWNRSRTIMIALRLALLVYVGLAIVLYTFMELDVIGTLHGHSRSY